MLSIQWYGKKQDKKKEKISNRKALAKFAEEEEKEKDAMRCLKKTVVEDTVEEEPKGLM